MTKLLLLFFTFCSLVLQAQELTVMTYNIRYHNHGDGVNGWHHRKQKVATLILKSHPDVLAVQEALFCQMKDLTKILKEYAYVGVGREDGKEKGEYAAIFYKKSKLRVAKSGSFWLSETPNIPGSRGWDAVCTRMATWAQLEDVTTQQKFLVATSHLDHIGQQARLNSIKQLKQWIATHNDSPLPTILCGDFNFHPTEEPYQEFFTNNTNWIDARPATITQGTYCGFEVGKMPCEIIDYVWYTREWLVNSFDVIEDNDGKYYPSDHLPVRVTMSIRP